MCAALLLLIQFTFPVCAADFNGNLHAENICVMNTEYSEAVYTKNADEKIAPGPSAKYLPEFLLLSIMREMRKSS